MIIFVKNLKKEDLNDKENFKEFISILLVFFAVISGVSMNIYAESNMIPNYEVKLLLDPDIVVNSDDNLKKIYRDIFNTGKSYNEIAVEYLDTYNKEFNNEGWVNRIRIKENKDKFELTYKKRYKIFNQNINDALG